MPDVIVLSDSEDDLPQLSKLSLNSSPLSHVSDSEPETGLLFSDLESPATPSTPKRLPKAKKKRRVTIITIADSDSSDDAALPCDKIVSTARKPQPVRSIESEDALTDRENVDPNLESDNDSAFLLYDPRTPTKKKSFKPVAISKPVLTPRLDVLSTPLTKPTSTPRPRAKSAKKQAQEEWVAKRDVLCADLAEELDNNVFGNRLPPDLVICWNVRLNTSAGRAHWKRIKSPDGYKHEAKIELSTKVVDSEKKLRCTLSHELCHVMSWVVENEIQPAHGPAFKSWARKITRQYPDIEVSVRHSYEIDYKYRWQCTVPTCAKIYGRHSKSIDVTKKACGACHGTLVFLPLKK